jgi:hypothetical protein
MRTGPISTASPSFDLSAPIALPSHSLDTKVCRKELQKHTNSDSKISAPVSTTEGCLTMARRHRSPSFASDSGSQFPRDSNAVYQDASGGINSPSQLRGSLFRLTWFRCKPHISEILNPVVIVISAISRSGDCITPSIAFAWTMVSACVLLRETGGKVMLTTGLSPEMRGAETVEWASGLPGGSSAFSSNVAT